MGVHPAPPRAAKKVNAHMLRAEVEREENRVREAREDLVRIREEFETARMTYEEHSQQQYEAEQKASEIREEYVNFVAEKSKAFEDIFAVNEADQAKIDENLRRLVELKAECWTKARQATELLAALDSAKNEAEKCLQITEHCKEGIPKLTKQIEKEKEAVAKQKQKAWDSYCDFQKNNAEIDELRKKINKTRRTVEVFVLNMHPSLVWPYDTSVEAPYILTIRREMETLREVQEMEKCGLLVALGMDPEVSAILENMFRDHFPHCTREGSPDSEVSVLRSRIGTHDKIEKSVEEESTASLFDILEEDSSLPATTLTPTLDGNEGDVALLIAPVCDHILDFIGSLGRKDPLFDCDRLIGNKNCAYAVVLMAQKDIKDPVEASLEALIPKWRMLDYWRKPKLRLDESFQLELR